MIGAVEKCPQGERMSLLPTTELSWRLVVFAPRFNGYSKTIMEFCHDIDMYPVTVYSDYLKGIQLPDVFECQDERRFVFTLQQLFGSKGVTRLIRSLVTQVRELESQPVYPSLF